MEKEVFDKLIMSLLIGCGSYPALTGHHLTKEQYDEICAIFQKRKETIDRYINATVKCRLINKNDLK